MLTTILKENTKKSWKIKFSGIIGEVMYTELWPDRTRFEKHSIISVMMPNVSLTTHL